jgi:iron(III) transport system substrate-binding protein
MKRQIRFFVFLTVILTVLLAACTPAAPAATEAPKAEPTKASEPAKPAEPAKTEPTKAPAAQGSGKLTVLCTPQEDWCVALTKAFQAETGIETNYVRLSSGESVARLRAGKDNPEFDVWFGGPADGYMVAKNEGLLEAYVSPVAAKIPEQIKDKDGYWTGIYVGALGFCSNKDVLDKMGLPIPTSWEDLLNEKLKGQLAMAHPATSGTAFTAFWTVVTLNEFNIDKAFEYFKKLHNNILQYTKTGSAPGPMAGRGEVATAIIFSHDCVKFQEEGMKNLVISFPKEGTGYEVGGVGIVKGTQNMDAAKKWVDYVLAAKTQELAATVKSFQIPTNPEAKVPEKAVKLAEVKLVEYDFTRSAKEKKGITERFDSEIAPAPKQ